jgi:hypothetical protein
VLPTDCLPIQTGSPEVHATILQVANKAIKYTINQSIRCTIRGFPDKIINTSTNNPTTNQRKFVKDHEYDEGTN